MEIKKISLKLPNNTDEEFKELNFRYNESIELFEKFKKLKEVNSNENELFNILKKIIDLVDINPIYNYHFLKYHQKIKEYYSFNEITKQSEKFTYKENFKKLKETLKTVHFLELTNSPQLNPALDIYELINLYLDNKNLFFKKSKEIRFQKLNCPLIECIERVRICYYKNLFKKPNKLCPKKRKVQFENIINKIENFEDIIKKMKKMFESINLDEEKLNKKIFLFMAYLEIINSFTLPEYKIVLKVYEKEFNPIIEYKNIKKKLNNKSKGIINDFLDEKYEKKFIISKMEILNEKQFKVYNKFESFILDRSSYVLENLIEELKIYHDFPLQYLLERNQTINSFFENNINIINDKDLFPDFKKYFKSFIKSTIVKEALQSSGKHDNIIKLIESDFINEILDDKYIISFPFYNKVLEGFTNKDFLISGISGFPFIISNYGKIVNIEEYNNLKNVSFIFNVAIKLLICMHEILIHLAYGYLFHISYGKISPDSHESNKADRISNSPSNDGGLFFEELLFGKRINKISFNNAIRLLNGNFSNLKNFRKELDEPIDINDKIKQGEFLKMILNKYKIDINLFNFETVSGSIRGMFHEMAYIRGNY